MMALMPRASSARAFAIQTSKSSRPWPGGGDEAGTGIVGDVVAFEQRHAKFVTAGEARQRMPAFHRREHFARYSADFLIAGHTRLFEDSVGECIGQDKQVAGFRPIVRRRFADAIEAVNNLRREADAAGYRA